MKRFPRTAFTLVEMIVVMAIILILVGLAISMYAYAENSAARTRARGEIAQMSTALESYRTDFAAYPQDAATDALDPRVDVDPIGATGAVRYRAAGLTLYSALSGDYLPTGAPDGKPEQKSYIDFPPNRLQVTTLPGGGQTVVCLRDPFGNCYGYSTAGLAQEERYQAALQSDPTTSRPSPPRGYNPTFDLWSTAGQATSSGAAKWVRNLARVKKDP